MFNIGRFKWALRKAILPIGKNDLVLDVGSGGTPYPRSDVLIDRLVGAEHRCGAPMLIDRPAVFGNASKLPFKDKSFDFVIASHILEHMSDPATFLNELQRVGKAGYIEVPNFIFERLIPYSIHCLEIASVNGTLHIHKKSHPVEDSFLGNLKFMEFNQEWKKLLFRRPQMFHVRFFWNDKIHYHIHNPDASTEWIEDIALQSVSDMSSHAYLNKSYQWRRIGLAALANWQSWRRGYRLRNFDINSVLACPECKGNLTQTGASLNCEACELSWPQNPYPNFTESKLNESNHAGRNGQVLY